MNPVRVLLLLVVASVLAGCGRPQTRVEHGNLHSELHAGNGTEPQDIDPHTVQGVSEHNIIAAVLEGLVGEDPVTLDPVPGVPPSESS